MGKNFLLGGFVLLIVMQAPLLLALDCNGISPANYNTCMEILNTTLSDTEKSLLLSNLDYSNKFYPDNQFVYERNTLISTPNAPNETQIYNGQFVNNAWVSLLVVMPSIIYNESLYVPNKTATLSSYNYQISIPSDYNSPGYPSTSNGDCKRIYTLVQNTSRNEVYVNNIYQGNGKLVTTNINQDSEIKSLFSIDVKVNIDHYSWKNYCSKYSNGMCIKYGYKCNYNYQEQKRDNPILSDSFNVKYYQNNLFGEVKTLNSQDSSTRFRLNYSNSIEVSFQNSNYNFYQYIYSINYSKAPYYFYTLKAEDYNQESFTNILRNGADFIIRNANNCTLNVFDWFNTIQNTCFLDNNQFNLSINTDKLSYLEGENISISIIPSNLIVQLNYNNQIVNASGDYIFQANTSDNRIIAYYGENKADKIIFVSDGNNFALALRLFLFFLVLYLIYRLLKKYWRFL